MADEDSVDPSLNDRFLDVFVYAPAGFILSALDDFPKLAALGRDRLGTQVSNARVMGEFVVKMGAQELKKRGEELLHRQPAPGQPAAGQPDDAPVGLHSVPTTPATDEFEDRAAASPSPTPTSSAPAPAPIPVPPAAPRAASANGHVPSSSSLAIPGFDTLSASQVVQRLDGLSRGELVAARAYEAGNRGRRTILSRIDQLLEERA
ncbi:MAG TPA: hypothetical protein VG205_04480 [Acidimicrobiales bacterium]|jgi:hypothetical protein|nr:hypothetical protein [Acidimicrobiales bacterium]